MVDQHAAHKRIIYERAILAAESGLPSTQQLLFPETIQFSATDFTQLKVILPELLRLGFDISLMSGFSAIINGVPADIKLGDEKSLLQSMIQQYYTFSNSLNLEPRERIALALANKTAIPRGKKLTLIEMETLVDQLFSCSQPYIDPLNKPTISYLALDEIRSRFRNH
jgi:DNA mismatch repair protein MutL